MQTKKRIFYALDIQYGPDNSVALSMMVTSYTMGGLIHILLVIAVIVVLVRMIQGRKVL